MAIRQIAFEFKSGRYHKGDYTFRDDSNLDDLNKLLKDGWSVVQMSPLTATGQHSHQVNSLLILEKVFRD